MHTRHDVADDDASAEVPDVSRSRAAAVFPASCFSAHPAATAYNRYNGTAPPSGGHHRGKRRVQDAGCHAGAFCPFSSSPFPHAGIHYAVFSPARHVPAPTRATRPTGRKSGISPRLTIHDTYRFPSFFSRQIPSYSNRHRCAREKPFFFVTDFHRTVSPVKADTCHRMPVRPFAAEMCLCRSTDRFATIQTDCSGQPACCRKSGKYPCRPAIRQDEGIICRQWIALIS